MTDACQGAARSLVAFDVDKTVLHQDVPNELEIFRSGCGQTLIRLARLGFKLAAVTGNNLHALSTRFLTAVVAELCEQVALQLITQFHCFCNGAAVYIQFDANRCTELAELLKSVNELEPEELLARARKCLFDDAGDVRPVFIYSRYILQCCIPQADADAVASICNEVVCSWWEDAVCEDGTETFFKRKLLDEFYIANGDDVADAKTKLAAKSDTINSEASVYGPIKPFKPPQAIMRTCKAADGRQYVTSCNLLPVLSFRHARHAVLKARDDPRMITIGRIQERMRQAGLMRYIVTAGGRATIDITHHLVSKRYALTWLLSHLGVEGVEQLGEELGMNAVYFGDEVVLNGNDLPVSQVPGVLVFAVNELAQRVPFRSNVELPVEFTKKTGPEATQAVLENLAMFAMTAGAQKDSKSSGQSIVALWRRKRLRERMGHMCDLLQEKRDPGSDEATPSFRRLEAATTVLTALVRRGDAFDELANSIIADVNSIGAISTAVQEQQFQTVNAQAYTRNAQAYRRGSVCKSDMQEDTLMEEIKRRQGY